MRNRQARKTIKPIYYFISLVVGFLFFCWALISILKLFHIQLRYQFTQSMPQGFYLQYPLSDYEVGDDIVFYPEATIEKLMIERGWLNKKEPLLKSIIASNGDLVCMEKNQLWINHHLIAKVYEKDTKKRLLPKVRFCQTLKSDEYWVMGISSPHSFDSRYFGVVNKSDILGKVIKL